MAPQSYSLDSCPRCLSKGQKQRRKEYRIFHMSSTVIGISCILGLHFLKFLFVYGSSTVVSIFTPPQSPDPWRDPL